MKRLLFYYSLYALSVFLLAACSDDMNGLRQAPGLQAGNADGVTRFGATLHATVNNPEGRVIHECGFLLSAFPSMADAQTMSLPSPVSEGGFSYTLTGLEAGRDYYYCAYVSSGYSTVRSDIRKFTSLLLDGPVFAPPVVEVQGFTSLRVSSQLLDNGGSDLTVCGFLYKETDDAEAELSLGQPGVVFISSPSLQTDIIDLRPSCTYVICAVGVSNDVFGRSANAVVTLPQTLLPSLSSVAFSDTTLLSVRLSARLLSHGTGSVTECGFCYSREQSEPTVDDLVLPVSVGDRMEAVLPDVQAQRDYYIRAYARNGEGYAYGPVAVYRLEYGISLLTAEAADIGRTQARLRASMTLGNALTVKSRGFCWTTGDALPTVTDSHVLVSGNDTEFSYLLTGQKPSSRVRYRPFADYAGTIFYGDVRELVTLPVALATVSTGNASAVTASGAVLTATVDDVGDGTVMERGFCWSLTDETPTIETAHQAVDGDAFRLELASLRSASTYHYRAYVRNEAGVAYGETKTFTTLKRTPSGGDIEYPAEE